MNYRKITSTAIAVVLIGLAFTLALFLTQSLASLSFPFEIDYGEGIVWQQALLFFSPKAYGSIDKIPFIVFHYTPLYHLFVLGMAKATGWDMLFAGRCVSIFATLMIATVIGILINEAMPADASKKHRVLASALIGLTIFSILPIFDWSQLMRVDMLAELLTLIGFWLGLKSYRRPGLIYLAAFFFVAAVYAKQNMVAAPIALFGLMLWIRPKLGASGIATSVVIGLLVLGMMSYLTSGQFINHILYYNINTFDWGRLRHLFPTMISHVNLLAAIFVVLIFGIVKFGRIFLKNRIPEVRSIIGSNQGLLALLSTLIYFMIATPMLILFAKEGANLNYTIEWFVASVLLIGISIFGSASEFEGVNKNIHSSSSILKIKSLTILLLIALHVISIGRYLPEHRLFDDHAGKMVQLENLCNRVRSSPKPVISDELVMLLRCGKSVQWESAIFAQLEKNGMWNPSSFITEIRAQNFGMFITVGERGNPLFDSRYSPAVADAIDTAYPLKQRIAGFIVHLPRP